MKGIAATLFVILIIAIYRKFYYTPPTPTEGTEGASSSSSTNSNSTNNINPAPAPNSKLTKAEVLEVQRQVNKRIKAAKFYNSNYQHYQSVAHFFTERQRNDLYILAAKGSSTNLLKEDGILGKKTTSAFQSMFGTFIDLNATNFNEVAKLWQTNGGDINHAINLISQNYA